jgi:2-polyprenyl-3-methyl-5-hydroxy-6-metoxy-1,4-benzoquinol methylase
MGPRMRQPAACVICGARELELACEGTSASPTGEQLSPSRHHPGEQPELHRCRRCRVLQARATEAELRAAYSQMRDEVYIAEEAARRVTFRRLLDRVNESGEPLRVLDVGCGPGLLLDEARRRGWRAHGVDLSAWAVEQARARGIDALHGTLEDAAFPAAHFDAVFMVDVLEHLPDPVGTLLEATRVLRPGGSLCVVTPDASSAAARLLGSRWWGMLPGHIVLFPHAVTVELVRALGYEVRGSRPAARHFSIDYLLGTLRSYAPVAERVRRLLTTTPLARRIVPVNLRDEHVLVATRLRPTMTAGQSPSGLVLSTPTEEGALPAAKSRLPKGFAAWTLLPARTTQAQAVAAARRLGAELSPHASSYGATQKACLVRAMQHNAAAVVVVKADNEYDTDLIARLAGPVLRGEADLVLGCRRLDDAAIRTAMPRWKRLGNKVLSSIERRTFGLDVEEFHSGYRAVSPALLQRVPFLRNSDGLLFDQELVSQAVTFGQRVVEVPLAASYFVNASPVGPRASIRYGLDTVVVLARHLLHRAGLRWSRLEPPWHAPVIGRVPGRAVQPEPDTEAARAEQAGAPDWTRRRAGAGE